MPHSNHRILRSMAETAGEGIPSKFIQENDSPSILMKLMSRRRTWVCLFASVYTFLLSLSWNLLKSALSWYETQSPSSEWPALYASVLLGVAFGVLSMVAALAVAVPAAVVAWITLLVLLAFCGKPRRALVAEGEKLTAEISGSVLRVALKEGNIVAAVCAVLGYFTLVKIRGTVLGFSERESL